MITGLHLTFCNIFRLSHYVAKKIFAKNGMNGCVLNGFIDSINSNPLQITNLILILFTLYVSSQSYISQTRAGLRESLEQLADLQLTHSIVVRVILHDFSFLRRNSSFKLNYYDIDPGSSRLGEPQSPTNYDLDDIIDVNNHVTNATDKKEDGTKRKGLVVECNTINGIVCRQVAEDVLSEIYDSSN